MGANSSIEWTHHTFNPWWGCIKVSPGCEKCYAETLANRYGHAVWGPAKTTARREMSESYWRQPLKWNAAAAAAGERQRVFCASMADVFEDHPQLPPIRARLWELIEATPMLDWLLLTKRPENIELMLPPRWGIADQGMPRNAWLGFSAEDQQRFDERWPVMESIKRHWRPSVVFLSAEPLLRSLDISEALYEDDIGDDYPYWTATLDWVICGGESGAGARPMHPDWARSLRDQCVEAEVPFLFKQWGEWLPMVCERDEEGVGHFVGADGRRLYIPDLLAHAHEIKDDRGIIRLGKKASGRLLDGREWNEFPNTIDTTVML